MNKNIIFFMVFMTTKNIVVEFDIILTLNFESFSGLDNGHH